MENLAEPMAIVGIGCRFPGGVHDATSFWRLLTDGRNAWSDVPNNRFNWKAYENHDRGSSASYSHRGGHFLDGDVGSFDAKFFGISAAEAQAMDPQQRIQLEVAFEALENAGMPRDTLRGSQTGVYVATFTHDYENLMFKDIISIPKYSMTGVGQAITANRISHMFDLKGPSITLDTGCSGSLVALHQACQSLRLKETSMALVGGTNLILSPDTMIPMDKLGILNSQGRCFPFGEQGSGYGRGEGVAMVVVKRLEDALRAGDVVRAVIRNTAVGQDGRTKTITLPDKAAQFNLIKSAYETAYLNPRDTGYIEAHGTGTVAGDLAEIQAIGETFCRLRSNDQGTSRSVYVGSVKANIGHLESTSGLAGLIKAILVIEKGFIPPVPGFRNPKKDLNLDTWGIEIPQNTVRWPSGVPRRASINSFGYGGTNAHVIIESEHAWQRGLLEDRPNLQSTHEGNDIDLCNQGRFLLYKRCNDQRTTAGNNFKLEEDYQFPSAAQRSKIDIDDSTGTEYGLSALKKDYMYLVTSNSESSLRRAIQRLSQWAVVSGSSANYLPDLSHTLNLRRGMLPWRYAFVSSTHEGVLAALDIENIKPRRVAETTKVVLVFTGQGAQWAGMARELISVPSFRDSFNESNVILQRLGARWDLWEEIMKDEQSSKLHDSRFGHPVTTAIQIALVQTLRLIGVQPVAVIGHSSGEIAAAYAAGALSHSAALQVVYHRSLLAHDSRLVLQRKGAMLAVSDSEKVANTYISNLSPPEGRVVVACVNSPTSTTISGDEDAIKELQTSFSFVGIHSSRLKVDAAYHSHHMQAVAEGYMLSLEGLSHTKTQKGVQFYSSVTATEKTDDFGPAYWVSNLVSKVRFSDAFGALYTQLCSDGNSRLTASSCTFMEIGPHDTLVKPINQMLTKWRAEHSATSLPSFDSVPTLTRNRNSQSTFLKAVGLLLEHGYPVDVQAVNQLNGSNKSRLIVDLPPYSWDHSQSFWHQPRPVRDHLFRSHTYHELVGLRQVGVLDPVWLHDLCIEESPWLRDHAINGIPVFPTAGYIAMAMEAKRQITLERSSGCQILEYFLKEIILSNFLNIPTPPESVSVQISLRYPDTLTNQTLTGWEKFRISSVSDRNTHINHCHGFIKVKVAELPKTSTRQSYGELEWNSQAQIERLRRIEASAYSLVPMKSFYDELQSIGNLWGPTFALVERFAAAHASATGSIRISNLATSTREPYVIHPTTLDALMHTGLMSLSRISEGGVMFPTKIGGLNISADVLNTPGEYLTFATSIEQCQNSYATMDTSAFQEGRKFGQSLCITMRGGEIRRLSKSRDNTEIGQDTSNSIHRVAWGTDVDHYILPTKLNWQRAKEDKLCDTQTKNLSHLDEATLRCILACKQETSSLEVMPQFSQYFSWMTACSKQANVPPTLDIDQDSLNNAKEDSIENEMLSCLRSSLPEILIGRRDALSTLFQREMLSRFYAEDEASRRCYANLADYVRPLSFKRPLRILEIGAGTGGATLPLLEALDVREGASLQHYEYTDVSSAFFDKASQKFSKWKRKLSFRTLDISKHPHEQGFDNESYDLVLASNALHTTSNVDNAIANARALVKPGGRLILIEITRLTLFINAVFGLLPGWYMDRTDGRKGSPILTCEEWHSRLLRGGFNGIEVQVPDSEGFASMMSMIVSRAVDKRSISRLRRSIKIVLGGEVAAEFPNVAENLSSRLSDLGIHTTLGRTISMEPESWSVQIISIYEHGPLPSLESWKTATQPTEAITKILWVLYANSEVADFSRGFLDSGDEHRDVLEGDNAFDLKKLILCSSISQGQLLDNLSHMIQLLNQDSNTPKSDETYFLYQNGTELIPRIEAYQNCNTTDVEQDGERISFADTSKILTLDLHSSESHKEARFLERTNEYPELKPDEVEVRVQAFELKPTHLTSDAAVSSLTGVAGSIVSAGSNVDKSYRVGERVCCWTYSNLSSRNRVPQNLLCKIPENMPVALAVSMAVPFTTAYYALLHIARLEAGQTLIVHSAANAIGVAAIRIAAYIGAGLIAIVDTPDEKTAFLAEVDIPEECVFLKGETDLKPSIRKTAKKSGVDAVLSIRADDFLEDSLACLEPFGVFVMVGKEKNISSKSYTMSGLASNIIFASIDPESLQAHQPNKMREIMSHLMSLFQRQELVHLQPLCFPLSHLNSAFEHLRDRECTKSAIIEISPSNMLSCTSKPGLERRAVFSESGTYIIASTFSSWNDELCSYLTDRGARRILVLTWTGGAEGNHEWKTDCTHIKWVYVSCHSKLDEVIERYLESWPPLKGIIHIHSREKVGKELSRASNRFPPKATQHDSLKGQESHVCIPQCISVAQFNQLQSIRSSHRSIDFWVTLGFFDNARQALDHAILNSVRDTYLPLDRSVPERQSRKEGAPNFGPNSLFITASHIPRQSLKLRGRILSTLDHALSRRFGESREHSYLIGIDAESLSLSHYEGIRNSPVLSHVLHSPRKRPDEPESDLKVETKQLSDAETPEDALQIITSAIRLKVSTYVAIAPEMIDLKAAVEDLGLDSLMRFEFKDWIYREYHANVESREISEARSILDLAATIISRTNLIAHLSTPKGGLLQTTKVEELGKLNFVQYPRQPLMPLEHTLQEFLKTARTFSTNDEFERVCLAANTFKNDTSSGSRLHGELVKVEQDPHVENWLSHLYSKHRFLKSRTPLVNGMVFFGTHPSGVQPHQQAERAALITLATLAFKRRLDGNELEQYTVGGQLVDLESQSLLFNTCREARVGEDCVKTHSTEDYVVALRCGNAFKIPLAGNVGFESLERAYERIIRDSTEKSNWIGLLTADERNKWAKSRSTLIESSATTKSSIQDIEAATFLVCLDNAAPETAKERCNQFLFSKTLDRWYDKTLQFIICSNGLSASLFEHSSIDGVTVQPLHDAINHAIKTHTSRPPPTAEPVPSVETTELHFLPNFSEYLPQLRVSLNRAASTQTFASIHTSILTPSFLRQKRCPTYSGIQIAIQLSLRRFFRQHLPACETVSLAHFRRGRVEVHHVNQDAVTNFLDSAITSSAMPSKSLQASFYSAVTAHVKSLSRCSAGKGFSRHLLAMEWMLAELRKAGDGMIEEPELFQDEVYKRLKPGRIMTSSFSTGWEEGGFVYPVPGGVLIYFEPLDEEVRFSIFGNGIDAEAVRERLIEGLGDVRALLEWGGGEGEGG